MSLLVPTQVAEVDRQLAIAVNADHMNLEQKLANACIPCHQYIDKNAVRLQNECRYPNRS